MNGFRTVCDHIYHDQPEKADKAKTQFIIYKNRAQGVFSSGKVFQHAESMPAHMMWWPGRCTALRSRSFSSSP